MVHLVLFLLGLCLGATSAVLTAVVDRSRLNPIDWEVIGWWIPFIPLIAGMSLLYLLVPPATPAVIALNLSLGWVVGIVGSIECVKKHWPQLIPQKKSEGG